jgi:hypothetical protein
VAQISKSDFDNLFVAKIIVLLEIWPRMAWSRAFKIVFDFLSEFFSQKWLGVGCTE